LFEAVRHEPGVPSPPAFVHDDRGLVTVTGSNEVSWWDAETGAAAGFRAAKTPFHYLRAVGAGPRGAWFAAWGSDGAVLWRAADGGEKPVELRHRNAVRDCAFGTDGGTVLTVSWDHTARLWSLPDGRAVGSPLLHTSDLARCALSDDGTRIATATAGGHVRVWKRPAAAKAQLLATLGNRARLGPDGRLFAPGQWHEMPTAAAHLGTLRVRVLEVASGKPAGPAVMTDDFLVDSCVRADNRTVAVASGGDTTGQLGLYDVPAGRCSRPATSRRPPSASPPARTPRTPPCSAAAGSCS
jgi:WD40 repeat protein